MSDSPLLPVTRLFCASLGFTVARTLPAATSFYSWFTKSGLKMAEHRGYGQSACKMFGLVPAPKLSVPAMALSGVAFLALLILPCLSSTPDAWRAPMLGAALVPYHLYFSQLYCEAHIGAHVTVLVPPALLLLALSPSLDASSANADATAAFTCWLMKIVLTSAYCGAGVCKLTHSLKSLHRGGVPWWSGSTLQAFLFEAMFISNKDTHTSFGVPTPFSYYLQKLHYLNPRTILLPASIGALAFETLAPLLLLAPHLRLHPLRPLRPRLPLRHRAPSEHRLPLVVGPSVRLPAPRPRRMGYRLAGGYHPLVLHGIVIIIAGHPLGDIVQAPLDV